MAIIAIPGLIALVPHVGGGAILSSASSGYIAGTLIPASVVTAVPAVLGTVLVAGAVAGSAYLYLHGIPAPIAEIFAAKGLGSFAAAAASPAVKTPVIAGSPIATAAPAFVVPVAQIAAVLAGLAVVGYIAYTHSDTVKNAVDSAAAKVKANTLVTVAEIMDALKKATSATSECTAVVMGDAKNKISNLAHTLDQVADNMKENILTKATQLKESFDQGADKVVTPEKVAEIAEALGKMATLVSKCTEEVARDAKSKFMDVTDAIGQLAEKAKEGVACNTTKLKESFDQGVDKVVTPEKVAEIAEALGKMATLVNKCTEEVAKDAKAKIMDVTDAIDQLTEKAKEGVACNASQLRATIDKATDKLDTALVDIKKHLTPGNLKS